MSKFIILLVIVVVAIGAYGITRHQGKLYERFMATAIAAEGSITAAEMEVRDQKTPQRKTFVVRYTYRDQDGNEYQGQDTVEYPELQEIYAQKGAISVLYRRDKPGQSFPKLLIERRLKMAESLNNAQP